ncbi:MAG: DUF3990 domain-containing protein [Tannerella sp.]|jgi:hypothetical protein|nr:DUF3990 domain-containing protein [Tannerella sp.]
MKVYHGSYTEIRTINLSTGRTDRDFGRGFYVTKHKNLAQKWAERKGEENQTDPVVTEFIFDDYIWEDTELKRLRFENYSDIWLEFIVQNRTNRSGKQVHDYDLVEGPIADDAVSVRVDKYIRSDISKGEFLEELKFKKPTHQICFCTTASLQALAYTDSHAEWNIESIAANLIKQIMIDGNMDEMRATDLFFTSDTFSKLSDKMTALHLKSQQEIYEMLKKEINL